MKTAPIIFGLAPLLLAGCSTLPKVGPNHSPPDVAAPADWFETVPAAQAQVPSDMNWWRLFGDPVLDSLVSDVLAANRSIAAAKADLRRARSLRRVAEGGLGPDVGASGTAQAISQSENGLIPVGRIPGAKIDTGLFDAGFDASWEIDLFGGKRREVEAAEARAQAAAEALEELRLSLAGETARTYFELRGLQQRLVAARRTAELQREDRDLVVRKVRAGAAAELDRDRADRALSATEATLPGLEAEIRAAAYRLAVLAYISPAEAYRRVADPVPLPDSPQLALPSPADVLARRPDLKRAERRLAAETADIGVAMADLYPKLSLFGSAGGQATSPFDLLKIASLNLLGALSVTVPVFNRGKVHAKVDSERAEAEGALRRFEESSAAAVQEIETALARYTRERQALASRAEAVRSARRAAERTRLRYREGLDPLTSVIDSNRDLAEAESQLAASQAALDVQAVAVLKATGGALPGN